MKRRNKLTDKEKAGIKKKMALHKKYLELSKDYGVQKICKEYNISPATAYNVFDSRYWNEQKAI